MMLPNELRNRFLQFYKIAIADTTITLTDRELIQRVADGVGLSQKNLTAFMWQAQVDEDIIPISPLDKVDWLYDLAIISVIDGVISDDEREMLRLFCSIFGFKDENVSKVCNFLLQSAEKHISKNDVLTVTKKYI